MPAAPASAASQTNQTLPRQARLEALMKQRILLLDGAYGTAFQGYQLEEEAYRGERFTEHDFPLKGNHDILCLTRPDLVEEVHRNYLEAGSDIICTNTFNATTVAQADFGTEGICFEINEAAARIARQVADEYASDTKPRFVAGSIGPTNRT
ncbi:MAG: homocysteine S-methyltransferase family protein, partial [Pseudomonadales bacterium]